MPEDPRDEAGRPGRSWAACPFPASREDWQIDSQLTAKNDVWALAGMWRSSVSQEDCRVVTGTAYSSHAQAVVRALDRRGSGFRCGVVFSPAQLSTSERGTVALDIRSGSASVDARAGHVLVSFCATGEPWGWGGTRGCTFPRAPEGPGRSHRGLTSAIAIACKEAPRHWMAGAVVNVVSPRPPVQDPYQHKIKSTQSSC